MKMWAILFALCCGCVETTVPTSSRPYYLPDHRKTPGAIYPGITVEDVDQPNLSEKNRHVSESLKRTVFARYGLHPDVPSNWEIDHLIPLCIGGSNDIANLWPESYVSQPINAHTKDRLESVILRLVRSRKLPLSQAQYEMADNWAAAYLKYIGPLPTTRTFAPQSPHTDD